MCIANILELFYGKIDCWWFHYRTCCSKIEILQLRQFRFSQNWTLVAYIYCKWKFTVDIHTSFNNHELQCFRKFIPALLVHQNLFSQKWAGAHRWKFIIRTMPCHLIRWEALWIFLEVLTMIMEISFLLMLLLFRYTIKIVRAVPFGSTFNKICFDFLSLAV